MNQRRVFETIECGRAWLPAAWILAAVAAVALCSCQAGAVENIMDQTSVGVWATGDGMRVSPETGKYLEDRPDIHEDYPSGDYRTSNAVWSAADGAVSLQSGRNEFAAFQVIVEKDEPIKGVQVALKELVGPGGAKISGQNVALFLVYYVQVVKKSAGYEKTSLGPGWYAEALIPVDAGKPVVFDMPNPRNFIGPGQKNQAVWVDIFVPRDRKDAPPGTYTGDLTVTTSKGTGKIKVNLEVWDFALPDEIHCRGDIWNGSLLSMDPDTEMRYYQMAQQHRFHPGVAGYRPDIKVEGTKVTIDWTGYDKRLAKYFNGEAFTDKYGYWGPSYGYPIPHIQLPFNCNKAGRKGGWPIEMENRKLSPEGEAVWVETCRQFKEHFDADPTWRRVRKVVFLGGLDESYNQEAYDAMIYFSKLTRQGLGKDWFQYRIDGGYNSPAMRQLSPYVDLWVCHTAGWNKEKIFNFRDKGVECWFYGPMVYERSGNSGCGSNAFTDLDQLVNRGIGWDAWKYKAGYCQWEFDAAFVRDPFEPRLTEAWDKRWTVARNFRMGQGDRQREYNGSGLLIFRGELMGKPGYPIATTRLKNQRRGMQDYEYFWLLKEAGMGEKADALVDSIVVTYPFGPENYTNTDVWKHNPETWDKVRIEAGKLLNGLAAK